MLISIWLTITEPGRGSSTLTVRFFQVLVMTAVAHISQEMLRISSLSVEGKLVGAMAEMEFALMQLLKGILTFYERAGTACQID